MTPTETKAAIAATGLTPKYLAGKLLCGMKALQAGKLTPDQQKLLMTLVQKPMASHQVAELKLITGEDSGLIKDVESMVLDEKKDAAFRDIMDAINEQPDFEQKLVGVGIEVKNFNENQLKSDYAINTERKPVFDMEMLSARLAIAEEENAIGRKFKELCVSRGITVEDLWKQIEQVPKTGGYTRELYDLLS